MLINIPKLLLSLLVILAVIAGYQYSSPLTELAPSRIGQIDTARLLNSDNESGQWLTGGRDYQQSYYSPLDKIKKNNVRELGFAWQYEIDTSHGFEATPIVVDGVMFSSGPMGAVYALDARSGVQRWVFKPSIDPDIMRKVCCGPVNRGVAVWEGKVYVASLDGYLYALDAGTGIVSWKVDTITERDRGYTITGAPYIAKDVIVIGNSGAELDARGYVTAYDVKTGEQRWRFFTVPGHPNLDFEHPELEMAAKTWDPNSLWDVGLGGTVWDGMAYDPELNLLYVGTGNAAPYPRKLRSPAGGDNLFLSSILAINPDTGRLVWYYQTTPADNWDYTSVQKMILAELNIEGKVRKVIMQAPKNGFFYVLDRVSGELISAEPYVDVNWASHIDMNSGKPVETSQAEYFDEPKLIFPAPLGGHNWQPMSYNSTTGLVYIPAIESSAVFAMPKNKFVYEKGAYNATTLYLSPEQGPWGIESDWAMQFNLPPLEKLAEGQPDYTIRGFLRAWDPVKQKLVWEVETSGQWAGSTPAVWNGGGVMTTAEGLVFQGRSTGELVILDAHTGEKLHSIDVGTSMMAAPMTYLIDGEQYIAIMAGLGGARGHSYVPGTAAYKYGNLGRIIAFKLGGGVVPHRPEVFQSQLKSSGPPVARRGTIKQNLHGQDLFQRNCKVCHANGGAPDLTKMTEPTHAEFMDIVLRGSRANRGMGSFKSLLSQEDAESIHVYLIDLAWKNFEKENKPPVSHQPDLS